MKKLFSLIALLCLCVSGAWADLTPTVVVNENFDEGATLFTGVSRMSVENDNNVKFVAANNSTNAWSNATYNFNTDNASAVRVQFAYWLTNGTYNACFIVRDGSTPATHSGDSKNPGNPGMNGAFFSVGRSRQSSANWFSINQGKTIAASASNLGLWCQADIYIDLVAKTVDYTISELGGNTIKSESGIAFKDANATKVTQIDFFTYGNNEVDYLDNLVITKYVNDAAHSYTVNAVSGSTVLKQLGNGIVNEGAEYSVSGLPFAIMKDAVWYKLNDPAVSGYKKSFTMGTEDETKTVTYSVANDITYFFEAESILSKSYGNKNGAYSGGTTAGVYTEATLTMPNIAPGVYTVTVNSSVRRSNEDRFNVQVSTDGTNWTDAGTITLTSNVGGNYSAQNVILPANGSIRLVEVVKQNMCHYVDYVTLEKTGEVSAMSAAGYTTFSSTSNIDADAIVGGKAYVINAFNAENVVLTPATGIVPANTGMIIAGEGGAAASAGTVTIPVSTADATFDTSNNLLVACATATTVESAAAGKKNYVLAYNAADAANTIGFYYIGSTSATVAAGKAYLTVDEATPAKMFRFTTGNTTGIKAISNEMTANKATKRIMNGQLVIEKAGKMYNAAGAQVK